MAFYFPQIEKLKLGEVVIRSPHPEDAQALLDLFPIFFNSSSYLITEPDEYKPIPLAERSENIRKMSESEGDLLLVAELQGKIIGHLDFNSRAQRRRIAHRGQFGMSVHPDFRGQGVGRALIQNLIHWVKAHPKMEIINLGVLEPNLPAIALYKSLGFIQTGYEPHGVKLADGNYLGEILMSLKVK